MNEPSFKQEYFIQLNFRKVNLSTSKILKSLNQSFTVKNQFLRKLVTFPYLLQFGKVEYYIFFKCYIVKLIFKINKLSRVWEKVEIIELEQIKAWKTIFRNYNTE